MKIHLRGDEANGRHTKLTVFLNGMNCGRLIMSEEEAAAFHMIVSGGIDRTQDTFVSSGKWEKDSQ